MSARDEVLARVRLALGDGQPQVTVPRDYRRAGEVVLPHDELLSLLEERVVDYRAAVTRASSATLSAVVAERLARHRVRRLVVPPGTPGAWLGGTDLDERLTDDPPLSATELDAVDGVVTGCAVAVAETGTLVLDAGPAQGRRILTLVPDYHLLVVRGDQVVAQVPDALARLDARRPLTWISGPSATSDIELNRVEGVHGPRTLDVVLVDDGPAA
ncbi:L-lactate dehydrogenase complex protein LldG [Motilibacter peucedani]|uniref:L-lactate dehydrogenase complex protein LldG n=1 Tax=Motilibacter peucedani TaxID=598650 RepID=A0A420XQD6_9ACTN|nr:lactate utilization protein C [Motilibacter peucedani]RKS75469.1 L-lactate dehydrogenase complex protein LldG [Motilibacter peucedani]